MNPPEDYTLLKGTVENEQQTQHNYQLLRKEHQQKRDTIKKQYAMIKEESQAMKKLSKELDSLIQKQEKKPRPLLRANYKSQKLQEITKQTQKMYKLIESLKRQIFSLKEDQPSEVVKKIQQLHAKQKCLNTQIVNTKIKKETLAKELQLNKKQLEKLKQASCLVDLQNREKEYEQVKRLCKATQKQTNIILSEELQVIAYIQELKTLTSRIGIKEEIAADMDKKQFSQLLKEIHQINLEKNKIDAELKKKRQEYLNQFNEIQNNIQETQSKRRKLGNELLRRNLDQKKSFYSSNNFSTKSLDVKTYVKESTQSPTKTQFKKIYYSQRQQDKTLYIGDWKPNQKSINDKSQIWYNSIEKVSKLSLFIENNKILHIKSTYIDKSLNTFQSRSPQIDNYSLTQLQISMNDLNSIQHSSKQGQLYIRFNLSGNRTKQIGKKSSQRIEKIHLQHNSIKSIQSQLTQSFITALKITLQNKSIQQSNQQMNQSAITQQSFSNGPLGPRRPMIKGRSLKKIREQPLVDHRLTLGKRKMV